jgi:hypothetical protein
VQNLDPVNAKGDWHVQHAFGDFCEFCHAGNVAATDKDAAHEGMVAPLADVQASCQQCHADDLTEKAQVYATTLGVDLNNGGGAAPTAPSDSGSPASSASETAEQIAVSAPISYQPLVDDPNVTDYVQRYNEIVLGKHPVNMGNLIMGVLIGLLVVGGGGFVILNEKLVAVSFGDTKKVDNEYPADVVDMLPAIAGMKAKTRKSLKNILYHSNKTDKVLGLIDEVVSDDEAEE